MELFKLRVQNLGRIENAELSIRPLTVFLGPNNTNKTWTAYGLYALAKFLAANYSPSDTYSLSSAFELAKVDGQLSWINNSTVSELKSDLAAAPEGALVLKEVARSQLLNRLSYPIRVSLHSDGIAKLLAIPPEHTAIAGGAVVLEMTEEQFVAGNLEKVSFEFRKQAGEKCTATITDNKKRQRAAVISHVGESDYEQIAHHILRIGIESVLMGRFENVLALPAERKALVTIYDLLSPGFADLLSLPVGDFVAFLQRVQKRSVRRDASYGLPSAAALLEEKLLGGRLDFEGADSAVELTYRYEKAPDLKMHAAGSLVRALAGLDVYLKHVAVPGDLLVIDEPEMNAHPEAQLMIAELLGVLVNNGVNVVVTTHSPYIVDHINNLAEAAQIPESKQDGIVSRFKLNTKEAFVSSDKVATYFFGEDGHVSDMFDRGNRIIDWSTFGETSDLVSNLYSDILDLTHRE